MSRVTRRPRLLLVALSIAVALLAAQSVVLAAVTVKSGKAITGVKVVTETDQAVIETIGAASPWTDIAGMSTSMNVRSGTQALLVITFSAQSYCQDNSGGPGFTTFCKLRVLVDGTPALPGEVVFESANDGNFSNSLESNSMQFVYGPVSGGAHTIKAQALVDKGQSLFVLDKRVLTVLRSKV